MRGYQGRKKGPLTLLAGHIAQLSVRRIPVFFSTSSNFLDHFKQNCSRENSRFGSATVPVALVGVSPTNGISFN
jgi:hypothetical protein